MENCLSIKVSNSVRNLYPFTEAPNITKKLGRGFYETKETNNNTYLMMSKPFGDLLSTSEY